MQARKIDVGSLDWIRRMRFVCVATSLALIFSMSVDAIEASELSIGGVISGEAEASVHKRLGPPLRRVETGEGIDLHYDGLIVKVAWLEQEAPNVERRVLSLHGTGRNACTPKGLCPGMRTSEAIRLYGHTELVHRETGDFLECQPEDLHCWLQISASSKFIRSIAVACQP
jgi:hypothetical protein